MKNLIRISTKAAASFLLCLLSSSLLVSVESRAPWQRPVPLVVSPLFGSSSSTSSRFATGSQFLIVRGGNGENYSNDLSTTPTISTENSNPVQQLSSDVARGGSTTTKRFPQQATTSDADDTDSTSSISASSLSTTTGGDDSATATATMAGNVTDVAVNEPNVIDVTPAAAPSGKMNRKEAKAHKRHKSIAKKLKNRNATNIRRKVLHASFGFFFAGLNHIIPKAKFVPGMAILTSATLVMELLRYRKGFQWMNDTLHLVLGSSLRKHEMDGKFTGSFYYFLGVTVTAALYPQACATLGICQLAIADPTASYFGRATRHVYWSRIENGLGGFGRNKGILGFLGGAVACVPMNYRLLSLAKFGGATVTPSALWFASFALGFAGALADLAVPTPALVLPKRICGVRVPPFHVDDNVVVPIVSGYACTHVFRALGWPADLALAKFLIC